MTNFRRTCLAVAALSISIGLSGCCVTGISSRKVQAPCQTCQPQVYEPIPQGIGPMDPPATEPVPAPYIPPAPTPTSTKRDFGTRTTQTMREFGDSVRDTFTR